METVEELEDVLFRPKFDQYLTDLLPEISTN